MSSSFDISNFVTDGFRKICKVCPTSSSQTWVYKNINNDLMFANHCSWVYFIVVNNEVYKVGETGNPLGIEESYLYGDNEVQPIGNSKCRLGRLRKGDGTDAYIRHTLRDQIKNGNDVSIWAKPCKITVLSEQIAGKKSNVSHTSHKDVEKSYLNYFSKICGRLPILNKAHK